jgi:Dolichyl-phosphate-mannose-protein mannosyltransferase
VTRSPQEFVEQFRADPSLLYLVARVTSAVFGALTAVAAGVLGTTLEGRRAGLIAGMLTAATYLLVRESHFGTNDALVTLLVTLGLVFCARIAQGGARGDYLAAGALAGLAFAAKYYGIVLLVPLALAHGFGSQRRAADVALALAACLVAAVVGFPSLLTEPGRVLQDIYVHLYLQAIGGYDGLDPSGGYVFYARALAIGLGWPLLLTCGVGLLASLARRERASVVVASLPVVLFAVLGAQQLYFARFALPAIPALLVLACVALARLARRSAVVGVAIMALVAAPSLVDAVRFDVLLTRPDTRTLTRDWIAANVPDGATIAVDSSPLGPTLSPARNHTIEVANDWSLFDLTPAEYRARHIDYVVVSGFSAEVRAIDPVRETRRQAFASELSNEASIVAQFRPYTTANEPPFIYDQIYGPFNALDLLERPGPTVTIYRVTR